MSKTSREARKTLAAFFQRLSNSPVAREGTMIRRILAYLKILTEDEPAGICPCGGILRKRSWWVGDRVTCDRCDHEAFD